MKFPALTRRTLLLLGMAAIFVGAIFMVFRRSGPFTPVRVTAQTVESRSIAPMLFGIGTVQPRYVRRIGPTFAGRVRSLDAHVGENVHAGQVLGEMDPVDLDERIVAQQAAVQGAEAALHQARTRQVFAQTQKERYDRLRAAGGASEETAVVKRQEAEVAEAALGAARDDADRQRAELEALRAQRGNLKLVAPEDGLVTARDADPGTTVVAGQMVIELIDPGSLWVDARFDQISAGGLTAGLPAKILLRSRRNQPLSGRVLWVEPRADAVTEEMLAKIVFDAPLDPLPPIGELAEVLLELPELPAAPVIPNAAIHAVGGRLGVWKLAGHGIAFEPITPGRADLEGRTQVASGLAPGDRVVVFSEKALHAHSRIRVVERLPGVTP